MRFVETKTVLSYIFAREVSFSSQNVKHLSHRTNTSFIKFLGLFLRNFARNLRRSKLEIHFYVHMIYIYSLQTVFYFIYRKTPHKV